MLAQAKRRASVRETRSKWHRPYAYFELHPDVRARWNEVHRTVQFALAIVAARDPEMRKRSAWRGEDADQLVIRPRLVYAAEGGVAIHVRHTLTEAEAFGPRWLARRLTRTDFRLLASSVRCKDGDVHTWHATTERMAEIVEDYARAFVGARGHDDASRARQAGRRLSGLPARTYRRAEVALADKDEGADVLWTLLDVWD
jgi:hypothetical protein